MSINQEKIFKFLWPDKCWHEAYKDNAFVCRKCNFSNPIYAVPVVDFIPDLSTPDGMVLILDRLVEMGYEWSIDSKGRKGSKTYVCIVKPDPADPYIYDEFCVSANAETVPLSILTATQALMEKEEKE